MPRRPQAVVIGDADAEPTVLRLAESVGELLAHLGLTVITGGRGGVMEAVSRAASAAGALTVGILPSTEMGEANPWCDVAIPTGLGHARNAITALGGDLLIVIGGGAGTLSEIALAWIHGRPILTMADSGGWAAAIAGHPPDRRASSIILPCSDLAALEAAIRRVCDDRGLRLSGGRR